jgi:hypothetical protein
VLTARCSVIIQASTIPGVDAASYARNYLKKYYNNLVDEEPKAPDARGKKKVKSLTVDLTIDEDTDSSSDESASGGSYSDSSDDE